MTGRVDTELHLSRDDLLGLAQHEAVLPIACVEGWSTVQRWRGVSVATLLALQVGGEELHLDHGFPVRLIAPNNPGVPQTKWVGTVEVL